MNRFRYHGEEAAITEFLQFKDRLNCLGNISTQNNRVTYIYRTISPYPCEKWNSYDIPLCRQMNLYHEQMNQIAYEVSEHICDYLYSIAMTHFIISYTMIQKFLNNLNPLYIPLLQMEINYLFSFHPSTNYFVLYFFLC